MRKIIALLLAACMLAGLPVVSFAAEDIKYVDVDAATIGVSIEEVDADGVVDLGRRSINENGGIDVTITVVSDERPVSAGYGVLSGADGFKPGFLDGVRIRETVQKTDGKYYSECRVYFPKYTENDVGVHRGGIYIHFEGNRQVVFPAELEITNDPAFDPVVVNENGQNVLKDGHIIPLGKGTLKLKVNGLEALKSSGISTLAAMWKVVKGNNRILINGEVPDTGDIHDSHEVNVADLEDSLLPFALDFEARTIGKVDIRFGVFDENDECVYSMTWGLNIEGELGVIDPDKLDQIMNNGSSAEGYIISIETFEEENLGLDKKSFEAIWEKAGGKPVEIKVQDGVSLTFDTNQPIDEVLEALGDKVFNPSVNTNIPREAKNEGFAGGHWVDFQHSGDLPGKVKIKVPVETGEDVPITLWYYNSVTGRADKQATKVETVTENGILYAVFTIDHCSAYALYPEGIDPNPVKNTSTGTTTPSSTGGGSSSSDKSSTAASVNWSDVRTRIREAKNGETVFVTLTKGERLSASVVRALAKAEGVTLRVRYEGETLYISSEDAAGMEVKDYSWKELLRLFGAEKEDPSSEADDTEVSGTKPNPGTGAYPVR